jgi:hypothetical protein
MATKTLVNKATKSEEPKKLIDECRKKENQAPTKESLIKKLEKVMKRTLQLEQRAKELGIKF